MLVVITNRSGWLLELLTELINAKIADSRANRTNYNVFAMGQVLRLGSVCCLLALAFAKAGEYTFASRLYAYQQFSLSFLHQPEPSLLKYHTVRRAH